MTKNLNAEFSDIIVHHDNSEEKMNIKRIFHTLTGECVNNNLYLYNIDCNSICKMDTTTGDMEIQYGDENKPYYEEYLYMKSVVYQRIVFFISEKAKCVMKYDTLTDRKDWIYFESNGQDFEPLIYRDSLYLLPVGYSDYLICINIDNKDIKYLPTNYNLHLSQKFQIEQYIFGKNVLIEDYVYRGSYLEPCIQKFHLKSEKIEYIKIENFNRPIRSFTFDGVDFWLLSNIDGMLVQWNERKNEIVSSIDLAQKTEKKNMLYATCIYNNGIIYIPEKAGTCILEYNIKLDLLLSYDYKNIEGFELKYPNGQAFAENIRIDNADTLYFLPFCANGVITKGKNGSVHFYKTATAKSLEIEKMQQIQNESICTLDSFCRKLPKFDKNKMKQSNTGSAILQIIC